MTGQRIVVMGVSGCGKSTVGRALAHALTLQYVEGDDLHPPQNVAKMASGMALTDDDRRDWLTALARQLEQAPPDGLVVTCSALKRRYRDRLRSAAPDLLLVHLRGAPELLADRLRQRKGHYMPASLLQSQLDALELPQADEEALEVDVASAPQSIVEDLVRQIQGRQGPRLQA